MTLETMARDQCGDRKYYTYGDGADDNVDYRKVMIIAYV